MFHESVTSVAQEEISLFVDIVEKGVILFLIPLVLVVSLFTQQGKIEVVLIVIATMKFLYLVFRDHVGHWFYLL